MIVDMIKFEKLVTIFKRLKYIFDPANIANLGFSPC